MPCAIAQPAEASASGSASGNTFRHGGAEQIVDRGRGLHALLAALVAGVAEHHPEQGRPAQGELDVGDREAGQILRGGGEASADGEVGGQFSQTLVARADSRASRSVKCRSGAVGDTPASRATARRENCSPSSSIRIAVLSSVARRSPW